MSYIVPPGLYALGTPDADSPVVVTANYKMSYDIVRRELAGRNLWLLVLETYGINVWCAAGKGTFGTGEIVRRVTATGLAGVVNHRLLILPILGAPGVAAHLVKQRTGFQVRYATIRAADLPAFLDGGMVTTPAMRELTFSVAERLVLTPVELVAAAKWGIPAALLLGLAESFQGGAFSLSRALPPVVACAATVVTGTVAAPLLLPWLPVRSFTLKGALLGLVLAAALIGAWGGAIRWQYAAALFLAVPAAVSFLTLTFTGSTPFTSRSGVKKEMRLALPAMAVALVAAFVFWGAGLFS